MPVYCFFLEALRKLNMKSEYKTLLKLRKPLLKKPRNNCIIFITNIYFNENMYEIYN